MFDLKQKLSDWEIWPLDVLWKNWGKPLLVAIILAFFVRSFFVAPFKIPTGSMIPTLMVQDRLFVNKITFGIKIPYTNHWIMRFREPKRGEIIVFKYPIDPKRDFIKRLIAVGGESVEIRNKDIYINGKLLTEPQSIRNVEYYNTTDPSWPYGWPGQVFTVPQDHYFVMGDNSASSNDGRAWGFVPKENLVGKAFVIYWPLHRIRFLK